MDWCVGPATGISGEYVGQNLPATTSAMAGQSFDATSSCQDVDVANADSLALVGNRFTTASDPSSLSCDSAFSDHGTSAHHQSVNNCSLGEFQYVWDDMLTTSVP